MIKAKAGGMLIDIVSPKELINSSSDDINRIGIIVNDVVYPLRSKTDSRPGVYPVNRYLSFLRNPEENEIDNYEATDENIIDFNNSKSIQDIINANTDNCIVSFKNNLSIELIRNMCDIYQKKRKRKLANYILDSYDDIKSKYYNTNKNKR